MAVDCFLTLLKVFLELRYNILSSSCRFFRAWASSAVKNSGIVWDSPTLDKWLAQPQSFIPNTRMTFIGIKKPDERRDVIAYVEVQQAR